MTCLVVGATGMIGRNLVKALLKEGHSVRVLARKTSNLSAFDDKIEIVYGDTRDPDSLRIAVAGVSVVYHLAGLTQIWIPNRPERIQTLYDTNVMGVRNMAKAALEANVERFIYTSTILTCGSSLHRGKVDEESLWDLWDIKSHYLRTRILAEMEVYRFGARGLPVNIRCPAVVLGAEDTQPTESGRLLIQIYKGKVPVHFDGMILPSVALKDIIQGHVLTAKRGRPGEKYLLVGQNLTLKDIITYVEEAAGKPLSKKTVPPFLARLVLPLISLWANLSSKEPFITPTYIEIATRPFDLNHTKAEQELGFSFTPAGDAIKEAVLWFIEQGYVQYR